MFLVDSCVSVEVGSFIFLTLHRNLQTRLETVFLGLIKMAFHVETA